MRARETPKIATSGELTTGVNPVPPIPPKFEIEKFRERGVRREQIEIKLNRELDESEYELFVKPYESENRLKKIKRRETSANE